MTKKNVDVRCLDYGDVQKISGNKVKQEVKVRVGVEQELAKKIVKLLKDSKMKVQAAIQGDAVRVSGAKRDVLQEAIALVKKQITDFPCSTATSATGVCWAGQNPTGAARRPSHRGPRVRLAMVGRGIATRVASPERWALSRIAAAPSASGPFQGRQEKESMEASAIAAMAWSNAPHRCSRRPRWRSCARRSISRARAQCSCCRRFRPPAPAVGSTAGGIVNTWA